MREKKNKRKPGNSSGAVTKKPKKRGTKNKLPISPNLGKVIRSPSEPMLYRPLLERSGKKTKVNQKQGHPFTEEGINKILTDLRLESDINKSPVTDSERDGASNAGSQYYRGVERDLDQTEHRILEAEKQKAAIAPPKQGKAVSNVKQPENAGPRESLIGMELLNDDDDFLDVACHLDENQMSTIRKGGFLEVAKMRPKDLNEYEVEDEKLNYSRVMDKLTMSQPNPRIMIKLTTLKSGTRDSGRMWLCILKPTLLELQKFFNMLILYTVRRNLTSGKMWRNITTYFSKKWRNVQQEVGPA